MKLTNKQIGLGSLAIIAAVSIPVAVATSCGSKTNENPKGYDELRLSDQQIKNLNNSNVHSKESKSINDFIKKHLDETSKTPVKENFVIIYDNVTYTFEKSMSKSEESKEFTKFEKVVRNRGLNI